MSFEMIFSRISEVQMCAMQTLIYSSFVTMLLGSAAVNAEPQENNGNIMFKSVKTKAATKKRKLYPQPYPCCFLKLYGFNMFHGSDMNLTWEIWLVCSAGESPPFHFPMLTISWTQSHNPLHTETQQCHCICLWWREMSYKSVYFPKVLNGPAPVCCFGFESIC